MKKIISVLLFLFGAIFSFAQDNIHELEGIKVTAPKFTGQQVLPRMTNENELSTLNNYLIKNIQFPEESTKWGKEGTEVVQFVVTPEGEVTGFKIINSVSKEIDEEVIRVLKTTNRMWKPGMNNETPVAMEKEVFIAFNISTDGNPDNTTNFVSLAKKNFDMGNKKFFIKKSNKSALVYYDKAIQYLPNDKAILVTRGMCRYELGDNKGAFQDWNRVKTLGGSEGDAYLQNLLSFKGYNDMINQLVKK